jgi:hypothetical protein
MPLESSNQDDEVIRAIRCIQYILARCERSVPPHYRQEAEEGTRYEAEFYFELPRPTGARLDLHLDLLRPEKTFLNVEDTQPPKKLTVYPGIWSKAYAFETCLLRWKIQQWQASQPDQPDPWQLQLSNRQADADAQEVGRAILREILPYFADRTSELPGDLAIFHPEEQDPVFRQDGLKITLTPEKPWPRLLSRLSWGAFSPRSTLRCLRSILLECREIVSDKRITKPPSIQHIKAYLQFDLPGRAAFLAASLSEPFERAFNPSDMITIAERSAYRPRRLFFQPFKRASQPTPDEAFRDIDVVMQERRLYPRMLQQPETLENWESLTQTSEEYNETVRLEKCVLLLAEAWGFLRGQPLLEEITESELSQDLMLEAREAFFCDALTNEPLLYFNTDNSGQPLEITLSKARFFRNPQKKKSLDSTEKSERDRIARAFFLSTQERALSKRPESPERSDLDLHLRELDEEGKTR